MSYLIVPSTCTYGGRDLIPLIREAIDTAVVVGPKRERHRRLPRGLDPATLNVGVAVAKFGLGQAGIRRNWYKPLDLIGSAFSWGPDPEIAEVQRKRAISLLRPAARTTMNTAEIACSGGQMFEYVFDMAASLAHNPYAFGDLPAPGAVFRGHGEGQVLVAVQAVLSDPDDPINAALRWANHELAAAAARMLFEVTAVAVAS